MKTYDFIVVGSGAAGLTAAYTAKGFGKTVLLVDKKKPGGDCTWSGCVPSKSLIHLAKDVHTAKKFCKDLVIDTSEIMKKVHEKIQKVYSHETPEVLKDSGIDFIFGEASLRSSDSILVNDTIYTGKKIILATGSRALIPNIDGLDSVPYLTNESFFKLTSLPKSITILGGGAIGIELSQALNRLGVEVTLIEMAKRILPKEEPKFSDKLSEILQEEGINILTDHKAVKFTYENGIIKTHIENNSSIKYIESESLLLALGRTPNIETLDLEKVGIKHTNKGITVNSNLKTSLSNVYAIGDLCSPFQFSHMANVQGIAAVKNCILPIQSKVDYDNVAWCTFSEPELARAGLSEEQAKDKFGENINIYSFDFKNNDRSVTEDNTEGFAKIITDKKGYIIGASILNERAGEIINAVQLAKTNGIKLSKFASTIHPYPTYGEFLNKLGKKALVDNLLSNPVVKLFRGNKK